MEPVIYAPNKLQAHVIDHQSGSPMDQERNVLNESARIARSPVQPLTELKADSAEALVVPGGFGAAKNLSDFGFKGPEMAVDPEVQRVLEDFHSAGKPIGNLQILVLFVTVLYSRWRFVIIEKTRLKRLLVLERDMYSKQG